MQFICRSLILSGLSQICLFLGLLVLRSPHHPRALSPPAPPSFAVFHCFSTPASSPFWALHLRVSEPLYAAAFLPGPSLRISPWLTTAAPGSLLSRTVGTKSRCLRRTSPTSPRPGLHIPPCPSAHSNCNKEFPSPPPLPPVPIPERQSSSRLNRPSAASGLPSAGLRLQDGPTSTTLPRRRPRDPCADTPLPLALSAPPLPESRSGQADKSLGEKFGPCRV